MVGRKATNQRAGNISDDEKQPYSIPTVFIMHICTSNVYWITLKLFNKTINVEFCVYFVSLMKNQLQGQNKCKYIYTSLLVVLNFSF